MDDIAFNKDESAAAITMDDGGRVTNWNLRAEALFGWTRDEALGGDLAELIIPEPYRGAHRRGLSKFLETGEGPLIGKTIELTALHKKGHFIQVEITMSALRRGNRWEFNAIIHDITERKRARSQEHHS